MCRCVEARGLAGDEVEDLLAGRVRVVLGVHPAREVKTLALELAAQVHALPLAAVPVREDGRAEPEVGARPRRARHVEIAGLIGVHVTLRRLWLPVWLPVIS